MELRDKVVMVTGAGSGIGAALCRRFAVESPRSLTLVDIDGDAARVVAEEITGAHPDVEVHHLAVDVADGEALTTAIDRVTRRDGTIDLYVGNAGIGTGAGVDAPDDVWRSIIDVNLMAHVHASRALLPGWLDRGEGHMLITASAAGLLTNLGDAPYSVTKHGAVALAEWLAATYAHRGIRISCLCPQGVRTPLLFPEGLDDAVALAVVRAQRILEPSEVADTVVEALATEEFLILPHPEVHDYEIARATDRDRWLRAMNRLQVQLESL